MTKRTLCRMKTRTRWDPGSQVHTGARRLDKQVRCIDESIKFDLRELRRRVQRPHRLRRAEGLRWCPECCE